MKRDIFPVAKSFLCHTVLAQRIEEEYGLSNVRCQLITATMRDVYLITSNPEHYIFYIYRYNQRTAEEIIAEWHFVNYLGANGIPVAPAILNKKGELLLPFDAPEGLRYGVLTHYAKGEHLRRRPSIKAVTEYGRIIANIHIQADSMPNPPMRPVDISLQLNQSVTAFATEFPERKRMIDYLRHSVDVITSRMPPLPETKPYYGLIHGDVIRANAQVAEDGKVTVIDFDLCGVGWRAYDVASFLITAKGAADQQEFEAAFLNGYSTVRSLDLLEQAAVPLFEAVRAIFSIGVPVMNIYHWGKAYVLPWLDYGFERVEQCMERLV